MSQEEQKVPAPAGGDGKRLTKSTGHSIQDKGVKIGHEIKFEKDPKYIAERMAIFEELMTV